MSSADESDHKRDTLDDGLLDPKHDRSNFEWSLNYTHKKIVETKEKLAKAIEDEDTDCTIQGLKNEIQRLTREVGSTIRNHAHLFE